MTIRSVIVSLVILLAVCVAIACTDHAPALILLTGANHLPQIVVFVLVVFALAVNPLLRLVKPRWCFSPAEMIVIWCVLAAGVGIPAFGLIHYMLPFMVAPFYFAGNDSPWVGAFYRHIPEWLVPSKETGSPVVAQFYEGVRRGSVPLDAWVVPFFGWGIAIMAFFVMVFCITAILRKQWVEHERLSFPLAQVPIEIVRPPEEGRWLNQLFRSPLMWEGAAIPLGYWALYTLHSYYPKVPYVEYMNWPLNGLFAQFLPGWSGWFYFDFLAIGVSFLLSTQISLSLWFFRIVANAQRVGRTAWGYTGMDFEVHQQVGAFLMFTAVMLWTMRRHLADVFRKAFRPPPAGAMKSGDDGDDVSYRLAVFGLIGSVIVMTGWLTVLGCPPHIALLYIAFGLVVLLVLSRLVCQAGLVLVQTTLPSGPLSIVQFIVGDKAITPAGLTALTFNQAPMYGDPREVLMPSLLNNTKAAEKRLDTRKLFLAMFLAVALAYPVSFFTQVFTAYKYGSGRMVDSYTTTIYPRQCLDRLAMAVNNPAPPLQFDKLGTAGGLRHMTVGAGAFLVVSFLRSRFYFWFLHPIGILTAQSMPLERLWLSIFIGWLCKSLVQKYARGPTMAVAKRFFLGLIIGAAISGMMGAVVPLAFPK